MAVFSNEKFIEELDSFYARDDIEGAGKFIESQYSLCRESRNINGMLTVLNEMTGLYRQTGCSEKGIPAIEEALELLTLTHNEKTVTGGTILLNCATTLKSFGYPEKAIVLYEKAEEILSVSAESDALLRSGLYNNMALTLQDLKQAGKAKGYFEKAIGITSEDDNLALERAITYINLSHLLFDENPLDGSINDLLDKAEMILDDDRYFSCAKYAFTCRKCAPSFGFFGRFLTEKRLNGRADDIYAGKRAEQKIL